MEILTISEYKHYQDNLRNVMIMIAKGIGLCGVDKLLYDDGQVSVLDSGLIDWCFALVHMGGILWQHDQTIGIWNMLLACLLSPTAFLLNSQACWSSC
jgi:hypothetical protein